MAKTWDVHPHMKLIFREVVEILEEQEISPTNTEVTYYTRAREIILFNVTHAQS